MRPKAVERRVEEEAAKLAGLAAQVGDVAGLLASRRTEWRAEPGAGAGRRALGH